MYARRRFLEARPNYVALPAPPPRFPMTQAVSGQCPICDNSASVLQIVDPAHYDCNKVTCPRCGSYALSNSDVRDGLKRLDAIQIRTYATDPTPPGQHAAYPFFEAVLYRKLRTLQNRKQIPAKLAPLLATRLVRGLSVGFLAYDDLANILTHTALPTPAEQADNLLRYIGNRLFGFGDTFAGTKEGSEIKCIGARNWQQNRLRVA